MRFHQVAEAGLELPIEITGKTEVPVQSDAKSGAVGVVNGQIEADLQVIIQRWSYLPNPVKTGILALVRAASYSD
ncbi:MAG: hypothetical protein ABGX16_17135 [Pirellulales bacterium]